MRRLLPIVLTLALATIRATPAVAQIQGTVAAGGCSVTFPGPLHLPITGAIGGIVIDAGCDYVYMTNTTWNRVEVFSLQTLSLQAPIQVGAQPKGLDITPDGRLLYVANSGGTNISVVDLTQRIELRKINVPPDFSNDTPYSIAIANNGLAMFSTTFAGSGFGARMMQLVLSTDATAPRTDFYSSSRTTEHTIVKASEDRSVIGAIAGDISSGPVFRYQVSTNAWSAARNLQAFIPNVSLDMTGSLLIVPGFSGTYVLDSALNLSGTVTGSGWGGSEVDPAYGIGYKSVASRIDILNLSTFLKVGELPLGDSVDDAYLVGSVGQMDLSGDGTLLAVITDNGFSLVRPWPTAPAGRNLVRNGTFASGLTRWLTFATPDPSYAVGGVSGGVFEFSRVAPPPGTSNQAVIYQETGMALPAGAPVQADFQLGNSSTARKRISVLVLDHDFSDLQVCTFWLPANLPLTAYRIRTHTTRPWVNASIYFYAATPGSDGGAYRIDNVSLTSNPALPDDRTDCVDPLAPLPPGGPDGADLLVNGDFATGTLTPWVTFGTIASQITGGIFEFVRPTSAPPAGVVLQATGQAMAANQILSATFDLGNSSAVRKRVTAILHDEDFGDLAACTFWLPAGQPLSAYALRTYATQAWVNATLSVYAATIGPDEWIQLDNATLKRTPGAAITGTECIEPVTPVAPLRVAGGIAGPSARARFEQDDGASQSRPGLESEAVDLTDVGRAYLVFESWLPAGTRGEVQVSLDGGTWIPYAHVDAADDWQRVETDLGPLAGRRVAIRFAIPVDRGDFFTWRVRNPVLVVYNRN